MLCGRLQRAGIRPDSRWLHIEAAVNRAAPAILQGLNTDGFAVVHQFFGDSNSGTREQPSTAPCTALRQEAEALWVSRPPPSMAKSVSNTPSWWLL